MLCTDILSISRVLGGGYVRSDVCRIWSGVIVVGISLRMLSRTRADDYLYSQHNKSQLPFLSLYGLELILKGVAYTSTY